MVRDIVKLTGGTTILSIPFGIRGVSGSGLGSGEPLRKKHRRQIVKPTIVKINIFNGYL